MLAQEQKAGRLLGLCQQILEQGGIAIDGSLEQTELLVSGLVGRRQDKLQYKNPIYQAIFSPVWIREQLNNLRPYSQTFNAWVASQGTDESRLLRGQALQDILLWANNQSLSDLDYRFLAASQTLDQQENMAKVEAARLYEVDSRLAVERQRSL